MGATFTGYNRTPEREWSTTSTVVADAPNEAFCWEVNDGMVQWGYRRQPVDGGIQLTEHTSFGARGQAGFESRFGADAERQIAIREAAAREGIPQTLEAIRRVVESSASNG